VEFEYISLKPWNKKYSTIESLCMESEPEQQLSTLWNPVFSGYQ